MHFLYRNVVTYAQIVCLKWVKLAKGSVSLHVSFNKNDKTQCQYQ